MYENNKLFSKKITGVLSVFDDCSISTSLSVTKLFIK